MTTIHQATNANAPLTGRTYAVELDDNGRPIRSNTPAWLRRRQTGLGASEGPAILGLSPWVSPRDVYLSKIAETIDDRQTEAMEFGHLMEPVARELFRRRHGLKSSPRYLGKISRSPGLIRSLDHPHLMASLDAVITEPDGQAVPGQIKNVTGWKRDAWRDADGGVPDDVKVQVIQEALVFGADHAWVLPMFGGNQFPEPIRVDVDREFADWWVEQSATWWAEHVEARVEPDPISIDDLSEVWHAVPGLSVDLSPDAIAAAAEHRRLKDQVVKPALEQIEELALKVQIELGEATEGWDRSNPTSPRLAVTWRQNREGQPGQRLDLDQLKADHPDLYEALAGYWVPVPPKKAARPFLSK